MAEMTGFEPACIQLRFQQLRRLSRYIPTLKGFMKTICLTCGKETSNPKFCSKSCSAKWTNKTYPKRKTSRVCLDCDKPTMSYRHSRCEHHYNEFKNNQYRNKTIGEYKEKLSVKGKHPSWVSSHIRLFAISWLRHLSKQPCRHCGYTKHVELAHIKSVSSFPDSTLLSEVNSETNVLPLCPNCHWEFDNLPRETTTALSN